MPHQTSPAGQSVQLYKWIAVTFLVVTLILFGAIVFMSAKRATITIETKAEPIDVTGIVSLGPGKFPGSIAGIVTTTLITGRQDFTPSGIKEEAGMATGVVTLRNDSGTSQTLVATTRLLSKDGVLFRLRERITVPGKGTLDAAVYADKPGKESEIGPAEFTIPGLPAGKQKLIYARSDKPMVSGQTKIGIVSQDDIEEAKKSLRTTLTEMGKSDLLRQHPEFDGAFLLVQDVIEPNVTVGVATTSFALFGKATVLGVLFLSKDINQAALGFLRRRGGGDEEVIMPTAVKPTVSVDSYDIVGGKATLSVFHSGVVSLNPESRQLEKSIFFGKTKDEVRRYVVKLSRVRGVEIDFRPGWMQTVPHVADHVRVIVKEVE